MQRSEEGSIKFPMGWEDSWCELPEYKIISSLVHRPTQSVKQAAKAIVKLTKKALDTVTLTEDQKKRSYSLVRYRGFNFEPEDALSEHVLLVFGCVLHLAANTSHRRIHATALVDFIQYLLTKEVKAGDETLNTFMDETNQRIWLDMVKYLEKLYNTHLIDDDFTYFHLVSDEESDNRVAFAARLCQTFYDAGLGGENLSKSPIDTATEWTELALEKHIAPMAQNVFVKDQSDIRKSKKEPHWRPPFVTENLLRAACLWFFYSSESIYARVIKGEDDWRRFGKDPSTQPVDEWGVVSWYHWRYALESYLGAGRSGSNRYMEDEERLSLDTESLIKEALEAMDKAERAVSHEHPDWKSVHDKKEQARAEAKAEKEADGEEWDSDDDEEFDDSWYPSDDGAGEQEEEDDEFHPSDGEESD